ncbi:hypothetical protein MFIFM68171_06596 [Madurella fahalii]|uniref:Metallo-beta-lactamase domain-containing protein n=1 Tax=Madurella fahalii TaxID=1157608 RepID=A0ABQ0GF43_9PEZI
MTSKTLFDIPAGATAQVSIIDSTVRVTKVKPDFFLAGPKVDGFDELSPIPAWSFLIQSSTGQKALFDLAVPPDFTTSFAPSIVGRIGETGWSVRVEKDIADILKENSVDPSEISSIIWSHWHWDHIGDPSTFPETTDLVVGPGFKAAFLPGYPTGPDSPVQERYFKGRKLVEIDFAAQSPPLEAGAFRAFDFFGDGSFYLLDTPGHAVGHLSGLARTTADPDTFVFMGGDLCHHAAQLRPSPHLPIPPRLDLPLPDALRARWSACPGGAAFEALNVRRGKKPDEPFFGLAMGHDVPLAVETVRKAQAADAREDVFFVFAHDSTIIGVVDMFPATANAWKEKGWREAVLWKFLGDLIWGL